MQRSVVARAKRALAASATVFLAATGAVTLAAAPASAAEGTVSDATLSWGVRESFRNYVEGPIAHGQITTSEVSESAAGYDFTGGAGVADPEAGTAAVSFPGSVHFQGHESSEPGVYILDMLIENVQVEVAGPDEVYLVADLTSRPFESMTEPSDLETHEGVRLVSVDADAVTVDDELVSADGAATAITADGSVAFGEFYDAGEAMDPVTFALPVTVPEDNEPPAEEDPGEEDPGEDPPGEEDEQPGEDDPAEDEQPGEEDQPGDEQPDEDAGEPSDEESPDRPENPESPGTDQDDPGPAVEQDETATTSLAAESTALTWGLKQSFLSYIQGPIAHGEVSTDGGITFDGDAFTFSDGTGAGDSADGTALIAYPGTISFTGHDGLLDLTVSDLRLRIDTPTTGAIVATMVSRSLDTGEYETFTGVDLAEVTLSGAEVAEGDLQLRDAPATLTEEGAAGFAGFYEAGAELDPVSAQITFVATEDDTTPPPPGDPQVPTTPGTGNNAGGSAGGQGTGGDPAGEDPAGTDPAAETEDPAAVCTANAVSGATLSWGLKSSFRSYISGGIANGGWTTSGGISDSDGGWTFADGSGSINTETLGGSVTFPGTLHFTGHDGILDLQISDLTLRLTGPTSGSLYADMVSNDMEGNTSTYSGIQLATVSFPAVSAGSSITLSGASVTLTSAGAEGFAGFYEAGTTLDTLDAELPLGGPVDCSAAAGTTLAATGADPVAPLLAVAGVLMLLGIALVLRRSVLR